MPYITVTANISQTDLGTAVKDVDATISSLGELPRGLFITPIGMSKVLVETLSSLQVGLLVAIFVIFLMLAANFQSFKVFVGNFNHSSCRSFRSFINADDYRFYAKLTIVYGNHYVSWGFDRECRFIGYEC